MDKTMMILVSFAEHLKYSAIGGTALWLLWKFGLSHQFGIQTINYFVLIGILFALRWTFSTQVVIESFPKEENDEQEE